MSFILKKILTLLVMPFQLLCFFLIFSFLLLMRKNTFVRGRRLLGITLGGFLLMGYGIPADYFLYRYERSYAPWENSKNSSQIRDIVVLGGGISLDDSIPPSSNLSPSTLQRLIEGIRIHRLIPGSRLILSGGQVFGKWTEASVMKKTALTLGVSEETLVLEDQSRDTREEARELQKILETKNFILVTSGFHMPRAVKEFETCGFHPLPAPTDFRVKQKALEPSSFFPGTEAFRRADLLCKEWLGILLSF